MAVRAIATAALAMAVLANGAGAADPGGGIEDWLAERIERSRNLSYEGTFVYREGDHVESLTILRRGSDGEPIEEHLETLNGPELEIHRRGRKVRCVWPGRGKVLEVDSRSRNPFSVPDISDPESLRESYRLHLRERDRVAGRGCRWLEVRPRDDYRYGYRFCLDRRTGVILAYEQSDTAGRVLQQVLYTDFRVRRDIDEDRMNSGQDLAGLDPLSLGNGDSRPDEPRRQWRATQMPPGFELVERNARRSRQKDGSPDVHLIYSDGLAAVSVFVGAVPESARPFEGVARDGALNVFGTLREGHEITAVGSVPLRTLSMIARSIRHVAPTDRND